MGDAPEILKRWLLLTNSSSVSRLRALAHFVPRGSTTTIGRQILELHISVRMSTEFCNMQEWRPIKCNEHCHIFKWKICLSRHLNTPQTRHHINYIPLPLVGKGSVAPMSRHIICICWYFIYRYALIMTSFPRLKSVIIEYNAWSSTYEHVKRYSKQAKHVKKEITDLVILRKKNDWLRAIIVKRKFPGEDKVWRHFRPLILSVIYWSIRKSVWIWMGISSIWGKICVYWYIDKFVYQCNPKKRLIWSCCCWSCQLHCIVEQTKTL